MTPVTKTIIVELNGYKPATIDVSQGDRQSRAVSCRLMADGAPWIVPEGTVVRVAYALPDGTPGQYAVLPDGTPAGTVDGHTVSVRLDDRIMERPGVTEAAVILDDGHGGQLATWPIRVCVQASPAANTHPESLPQLGAEYEGRILFVSGGVVMPLMLGPGLSIRDGVLYVTGGAPEEPEGPVEGVSVTLGEDGTIMLSCAAELDDSGTITLPVPVTMTEDGTIMIGGINNG